MSANSMMLITTKWGDQKTFRMIPISKDAPYVECIYDIKEGVLAVIGLSRKDTFHMVPKLNAFGDIEEVKPGKRKDNKGYAEERKTISSYYEYYLTDKTDIVNLITLLCVNNETFPFEQFLVQQDEETKEEGLEEDIVKDLPIHV